MSNDNLPLDPKFSNIRFNTPNTKYFERVSDYLNDPFFHNTFFTKILNLPQALFSALFNHNIY